MKIINSVRCGAVILVLLFCLPLLRADEVENKEWSAGYRFELLTADGRPANDLMGSEAFLRYHLSDDYHVEWSFGYKEYDFESPQRHLGFSRASTEDVDPRTRSTLIAVRLERLWGAVDQCIRPVVFAGVGMGYTVVEDASGIANGEAFDINAEGGIETVPLCGIGIRYQYLKWVLDGGLKVERHVADWDLEDRISGRRGKVGDYTAWGAWLGLSLAI